MKKYTNLVIGLLLSFILGMSLLGCTKQLTPQERFVKSHSDFEGVTNVYYEVDYSDIMSDLESGDHYFILVFNPEFYICPFCKACLPILNEVALENNVTRIDVLDLYEGRKYNTDEYIALRDVLLTKIDDMSLKNDEYTILVPDFYVVSNGEVLSHHLSTIKDSEGSYIKDLTEDNIQELKDIYKNMLTL